MPIEPKKYDVRLTDSRWDRLLFRAEHWLLSPGSSETGKLRGFLRVKQWRDLTSPGERLHAVKVAAKLPLRALRESWRTTAVFGPAAERDHGVSRPVQALHLWWLWVRYGVYKPDVYYGFRLYRPGQLRRGAHFFQADEADRLFRMLSVRTARDQADLLLDKASFERWLVEQGLPTTRTVLELQDGQVLRASLDDGALPRCDLFQKPNDALQGVGTQRWRFDGDGWIGDDGVRRTEGELIAELTEQSRTRGVLLQELLRNHSALRPLTASALSTVRVQTLRGLDGQVRVVLAVCKLPTGNASTDHMKYGGVAAPVDLATGRLGPAISKDDDRFVAPCERHPDTGVTIQGFPLPHWEAVMALAVRAHEALDRMLCIGWDIAILERGPIIIEGNDNPGHASSQLPTGVALGEMPIVPTLLARLREELAQVPPASRVTGARSGGIPSYLPPATRP